jgi:hypothetical protein
VSGGRLGCWWPTITPSLAVSDGALSGAAARLEDALSRVSAGAHVRIGFAGYDRRNPTTLDQLLHQAHQVHA